MRALSVAEPSGGLPADRLVALAANVAGWDVAFCTRTIDCLSAMPLTWTAFDTGAISWSQVRGIVGAATLLCRADRATLDVQLTGAVDDNATSEPERIVDVAGVLAGRLEDRRKAEREQATADRSYIRFQPTLLGGADFHGHGDDDQIATLTAALAAAADDPVADDVRPVDADGTPIPKAWLRGTARGAQLMEGLRRIATTYLAGDGGRQARPAMTVVVDVQTLTGHTSRVVDTVLTPPTPPLFRLRASRLLWNLAGARPTTGPPPQCGCWPVMPPASRC